MAGQMHPHVLLLGYYGRGNFGDDLMAWMIARHLAMHGLACTVFSLGEGERDSLRVPDFERVGIASTQDPDVALRRATMVVKGGGAMFVPAQDHTRPYSVAARRHAELADRVCAMGLSRAVISVGGDGACRADHLDRSTRGFLEGVAYASVRNREDLRVLGDLGVRGDWFPDIVWLAGQFMPRMHRPGPRLRIGLDIYTANVLAQGSAWVLAMLQGVVLARGDVTFVCLNSTHRVMGTSAGIGKLIRGFNVESYQFHDFETDATQLASLDLLVSTRLHVPLIALQAGVPVAFLLGAGKTRLFLESLGMSSCFYGRERVAELMRTLGSRKKLVAMIEKSPKPDVRTQQRSSMGHLAGLVATIRAASHQGDRVSHRRSPEG